ncbi:unnamed protein product [Rotaria socialis]|uniref:G-protein coupled receptors family 1 profile domain-containing protein n=2 Tax=Rotaria socialis TaxID=392032 RepID=A0A818ZT50_9BILA|nr:unnamed protein product [Rotaria socialis]CAF3774110.1 unnamed protein product [Rotaria socialis]
MMVKAQNAFEVEGFYEETFYPMLNLSSTDLVENLEYLSKQFNRYFPFSIFLFGMIGNILNCFVLSQPNLRMNPCAYLFLISSIANIISITFGLATRVLSGWHMDLAAQNVLICKCRAFVVFVSRTIAFWLIAYATIDRWFSSCILHQRRQMSSLKNSQRVTKIIILASVLLYCQMIYCYDVNITAAPLQCYGKNVLCRSLTDFTYATITVLSPLLIMCIFGLITISNIRHHYYKRALKRKAFKVNPNNKTTFKSVSIQRRRRKRINRYLHHVLFVQIVFLSILTVPQAIEKIYTTLTVNTKKSSLHMTIHKFIYNFVLLLTYLASGLPFYIYTLCGGSIFRNTLLNLLRKIIPNYN